MPGTVLVTGGSGFIGRHLLSALVKTETPVIALTRPGSQLPSDVASQVLRVDCETFDRDGVSRALDKLDFGLIYHLATYGVTPSDRNLAEMTCINTDLPAALVTLASERHAGVVITGSCLEYESSADSSRITESHALERVAPYGASKAAGVTSAIAMAKTTGTPVSVLRLFHVYGPGESPHRLFPNLVKGLTANRSVSLSPGEQIRDFVYVRDVVEALMQTGTRMQRARDRDIAVWNLCTGIGASVRHFCESVASLLSSPHELLDFGAVEMREDDIHSVVGNPERIAQELGWKAGFDLESGLRHALAEMNISRVRIDDI